MDPKTHMQQARDELMRGLSALPTHSLIARLLDVSAERDALAEKLACVRQALPEAWRNSVPSVAVATISAERDALSARVGVLTALLTELGDFERADGSLMLPEWARSKIRAALAEPSAAPEEGLQRP